MTVDIPTAGSSRSRAQIAFRYTRTDTPDTIASWDMETDPGWTQGGAAVEYTRTMALASATLHWYRGQGPRDPAGGSWFYALDSGADNDGSYNINANCWLRTTAFDCTNYSYVELNYKRWLGVENHLPASTATMPISKFRQMAQFGTRSGPATNNTRTCSTISHGWTTRWTYQPGLPINRQSMSDGA